MKKKCIILLLLCALLLVGCGKDDSDSKSSSNGKDVVESFGKAMLKMDAKKLCNLYHKNSIEKRYDGDVDDCIDSNEDLFDYLKDNGVEYLDYEILGKEEYEDEDFEDIKETVEETYDIPAKDVKKVMKYSVKFEIKGEDDATININVFKIGSKWYMLA